MKIRSGFVSNSSSSSFIIHGSVYNREVFKKKLLLELSEVEKEEYKTRNEYFARVYMKTKYDLDFIETPSLVYLGEIPTVLPISEKIRINQKIKLFDPNAEDQKVNAHYEEYDY